MVEVATDQWPVRGQTPGTDRLAGVADASKEHVVALVQAGVVKHPRGPSALRSAGRR